MKDLATEIIRIDKAEGGIEAVDGTN